MQAPAGGDGGCSKAASEALFAARSALRALFFALGMASCLRETQTDASMRRDLHRALVRAPVIFGVVDKSGCAEVTCGPHRLPATNLSTALASPLRHP